jgi:pimeloyl-ACP methyl ester carboxylesterase
VPDRIVFLPPRAEEPARSGVQPRIFARLADENCGRDVAFLLAHPAANFAQHYLIEPLQARGRAALGLCTRYLNNDSQLLMERVIQDIGAGVAFLRDQGFERIVLLGNSGGGAIASLYQAQAEHLTIAATPDGRPIDLRREDFPPADAIALASVHTSRAHQLRDGIDPALLDEADPLGIDPGLDLFNPANGPPFVAAWLERWQAARAARYRRLNDWVRARLRYLEARRGPESFPDEAFVIPRSYARAETLDPAIDPNDRPIGVTIWGDPVVTNTGPTGLARYTSLRSFLSQWGADSRADGPARLAETSVPVLNVIFSADEGIFPSETQLYSAAAEGRCTDYVLRGARHFVARQPDGARLVGELADTIVHWAERSLA